MRARRAALIAVGSASGGGRPQRAAILPVTGVHPPGQVGRLDEISQGPDRDPRFPTGRWLVALVAIAAAGLIAATVTPLMTSTAPATPGSSPRSPGTSTVTTLPVLAPVPASALPSTCVVGYTPSPRGPAFIPGPPPPNPARTTIQGTAYYPTPGYQLTLRNDSAATIWINGFRTVFYDTHGTEIGSDQETLNEVLLKTGQSFTWREYSEANTEGTGSGLGTATIPASSTTCHLATLYSATLYSLPAS